MNFPDGLQDYYGASQKGKYQINRGPKLQAFEAERLSSCSWEFLTERKNEPTPSAHVFFWPTSAQKSKQVEARQDCNLMIRGFAVGQNLLLVTIGINDL